MTWIYLLALTAAIALLPLGIIAQLSALFIQVELEAEGRNFAGAAAATCGLIAIVGFAAMISYFGVAYSEYQWAASGIVGLIVGTALGVYLVVSDWRRARAIGER